MSLYVALYKKLMTLTLYQFLIIWNLSRLLSYCISLQLQWMRQEAQPIANQTDESHHPVNVSASFLHIVPVSMQSGGNKLNTYAFLDSGSTVSFINQIHQNDAQHSWHTRNEGSEDIKASTQNMGTAFKGAFNRSTWKPVNIFGKYKLKLQQAEAKPQSLECSTQQKLHFDGVGIIFGQDAYELQRPLNYKIGKRSELFAVLTELGWVVSEPMTGKIRQTVFHFVFTEDVKEAENIQYWWDIETYDSKINVVTQSKTEVQRQKMLEVTKNFTGERYEVEMLWTESEPNLRNNYSSTLGQLYSLEQKFQRDPNLKSLY